MWDGRTDIDFYGPFRLGIILWTTSTGKRGHFHTSSTFWVMYSSLFGMTLTQRAFPCLTFIPVLERTPSFGAPLSTPINHCATSQRAIFSQGVAFNRHNHSSQHMREARQLSFHLSAPGQLGSKYSQQRGQLSFSSIDLPTSDMVPNQIESSTRIVAHELRVVVISHRVLQLNFGLPSLA
jgi:hypothetical protein